MKLLPIAALILVAGTGLAQAKMTVQLLVPWEGKRVPAGQNCTWMGSRIDAGDEKNDKSYAQLASGGRRGNVYPATIKAVSATGKLLEKTMIKIGKC